MSRMIQELLLKEACGSYTNDRILILIIATKSSKKSSRNLTLVDPAFKVEKTSRS